MDLKNILQKILKKHFTNSKKNGMIKSLNSRESTAVRSKKDSYLINNKCYIYLMIFLKPFDGLLQYLYSFINLLSICCICGILIKIYDFYLSI